MDKKQSFFITDPPVDPRLFFELLDNALRGLRGFYLLNAAVDIGIFDACQSPVREEELAEIIGADPDMCSILCEALVSIGLLMKSDHTVANTPVSSTYLVTTSPYTQVHYIRQVARLGHDLWASLRGIVRNGPVEYNREEFFREYSLPAMAENAVSGRLQEVTRAVTRLQGFDQVRRVLDLGGGHGLYAIALAVQRPDIEAWVFDLPDVVQLAGVYIARHQVQNVHLMPGDFFRDSFGEDYDLILSSSNPSGKSIGLLSKISRALRDRGYFVNIQSPGGVPPDPLQSLEYRLWTFPGVDKLKAAGTKEQPFMTNEYRDAMQECNLEIIGEMDIRDDYHRDTWVRMVISRKISR